MNSTARRLIAIWFVGAVTATAAIAFTSPLFVRSYLPLRPDSTRGVWTLPPESLYRWRSEGYADSRIGPLGMPGKTSLQSNADGGPRIALWGDSQAEGVCVSDREKLFAQTEQIGECQVFPLARSGEDAADWVTQMPKVETELGIDMHAFLIVDLPDLSAATGAPVDPPDPGDIAQANAAIAARLPAFVIQAARHVLTESDGTTRRELRFTLGPVTKDADSSEAEPGAGAPLDAPTWGVRTADWSRSLLAVRSASELPIVILYAPIVPQIYRGRVIMDDPHEAEFAAMSAAAKSIGLIVVDARPSLRDRARQGSWPHGFHNGVIGNGHLNAAGNAAVAELLVEAVETAGKQER